MGMLNRLIGMATKALSAQGGSRHGTRSSYGSTNGKAQMAKRVGDEVIKQVRKQGPDAAQRHLGKTRFGTDPRAQKAAKTADDLARRFAGSGSGSGQDRSVGQGPGQPPAGGYRDEPRQDQNRNQARNQWGEKP